MYVAITRARQRLYLSFSQTRMLHGQTRYHVKSRFLEELPEAALKWISPKNQGFGSGFASSYQQAWQRGSGMGSMVGAGRNSGWAPPAAPSPAGRTAFGQESPAWAAPVPHAMKQAAAKENGHGLRQGQSVFHTKFGEGVVLTLEGKGADARAQVNFGRHGAKWLALSVAKLTPIE